MAAGKRGVYFTPEIRSRGELTNGASHLDLPWHQFDYHTVRPECAQSPSCCCCCCYSVKVREDEALPGPLSGSLRSLVRDTPRGPGICRARDNDFRRSGSASRPDWPPEGLCHRQISIGAWCLARLRNRNIRRGASQDSAAPQLLLLLPLLIQLMLQFPRIKRQCQ